MSQDEVIAIQVLDGSQDANVFEQFMYHTFTAIRADDKYAGR